MIRYIICGILLGIGTYFFLEHLRKQSELVELLRIETLDMRVTHGEFWERCRIYDQKILELETRLANCENRLVKQALNQTRYEVTTSNLKIRADLHRELLTNFEIDLNRLKIDYTNLGGQQVEQLILLSSTRTKTHQLAGRLFDLEGSNLPSRMNEFDTWKKTITVLQKRGDCLIVEMRK